MQTVYARLFFVCELCVVLCWCSPFAILFRTREFVNAVSLAKDRPSASSVTLHGNDGGEQR